MKTFVIVSLATVLLAGVTLAQPSSNLSEQWFQAKFGRPTPAAEAQAKSDADNTAFREDLRASRNAELRSSLASDQWFRAKYGRLSPAEETRRNAEAANTAYRDAPGVNALDTGNWIRDFTKAKYGRELPAR